MLSYALKVELDQGWLKPKLLKESFNAIKVFVYTFFSFCLVFPTFLNISDFYVLSIYCIFTVVRTDAVIMNVIKIAIPLKFK